MGGHRTVNPLYYHVFIYRKLKSDINIGLLFWKTFWTYWFFKQLIINQNAKCFGKLWKISPQTLARFGESHYLCAVFATLLTFTIYYLPFTIYHLLFTIYHLLFTKPSFATVNPQRLTLNSLQLKTRKTSEIHGNISAPSVSFPFLPLFKSIKS